MEFMTEDDYEGTEFEDDYPRPDCQCDAPDPVDDEPWVPVECANCGGLLS